MFHVESSAVKPDQERSLRTERLYLRDVLRAEIFNESDVVFDIADHLASPALSMLEGGHGGDRREYVSGVEFVGLKPAEELFSQLLVRNYGV